MSYRIPDEGRLSDAIFTVMYRKQHVRSQSELAKLVRKELERDGEGYKVSEERIRSVALRRGLVNITIEYNETEGTDLPSECPVCRNPMESVMNMTLDGESKELKRRCTACPYSIGSKKRVPGRYTFTKVRR